MSKNQIGKHSGSAGHTSAHMHPSYHYGSNARYAHKAYQQDSANLQNSQIQEEQPSQVANYLTAQPSHISYGSRER